MKISISKIQPNPQQPRKTFDPSDLQELANSIDANGLVQPITVEDHGEHFILVSGERRLRAHKLLGLLEIEAHIIPPTNHNGQQLLVSAIVENVQRADVNPIDEARAYKKLKEEHGMSTNEIARAIGKHETQIYNSMSLLKYDPEIIEMIEAGEFSKDNRLSFAIMKIPDKKTRLRLVETIKEKQMTVSASINAANKIAAALTQESDLRSAKSPAIELAKKRGKYTRLDAENPPTNWDIRVMTGNFPGWDRMFKAANRTCGLCSLREMASMENCGRCPLAEFLISVVKS